MGPPSKYPEDDRQDPIRPILVMDDEEMLRNIAQQMLREEKDR